MENILQDTWDSLPSFFADVSNRLKLNSRQSHPEVVFLCIGKTFEGLRELPAVYLDIAKPFLVDGVERLKGIDKEFLLMPGGEIDEERKVCSNTVSLLLNVLTDVVATLSAFQKEKEILPVNGFELTFVVESLLKENLKCLEHPDISCLKNVITCCKVCWEFLEITKPSVLLSEIVSLQILVANSFNMDMITENMLTVLRCLTELTSRVNVSLSFVLDSVSVNVDSDEDTRRHRYYYLSVKAIATQFAKGDQILKLSMDEKIYDHLRKALKSADTKESKLSTFIITSFTTFFEKEDFSKIANRSNSQLLLHLKKQEFIKYWSDFFELFEILEEKQIHIIRPFFSRLKEIELNSEAAVEWYFVILYKMLQHDNRGVAKEGAERFLKFSDVLEDDASQASESQFLRFIEDTLFPILKDQVGWIFKEGDEFFRYADRIGKILALICKKKGVGKFFVTDKIMKIIQKAEKGLSAHFLYFLVLTLDSAVKGITTVDKDLQKEDSIASNFADNALKLIVRCQNHSLTTVDKFMKSEIEKKLIGIFEVLLDLLWNFESHEQIQGTAITFIGGLGKVFYEYKSFQGLTYFPIKSVEMSDVSIGASSLNQLRGLLRWNLLCILREKGVAQLEKLYGFCLKINDLSNWSPITVGATEDFFNGLHKLQPPNLQLTCDRFPTSVKSEIWKMLKQILITIFVNGVYEENFLYIVKTIHTIKVFCNVSEVVKAHLVESMNLVLKKHTYSFKFGSSNIKDFALCELHLLLVETCGIRRDALPSIEGFENFFLSGNVTKDPLFPKNELYLETFKENLPCIYYQLKFRTFTWVVKDSTIDGTAQVKIEPSLNSWEKYIRVGLDNMDLVGQSGVVPAAAFFSECSVFIENIEADQNEKERISMLILDFIEISWKNMEEQRKTENFWKSFKAIVEYMTTSVTIFNTKPFQDFVQRTFEYKDIMGMSLMLMEGLKRSWNKSFVCLGTKKMTQSTIHNNILNMCITAASFGPSMVNTLTVDFNLWEILTENSESPSKELLSANNFHSASQTRVLAVMFIQMVLNSEKFSHEGNKNFEKLLMDVITKLLQENEEESLNRKRYFNNSTCHRRKQRIAQSLVVLQYLYTEDIRRLVTTKLLDSLANDSSQASVRYLIEWVIIRNLTCDNLDWKLFFENSVKCSKTREGFGAFFATICLHTAEILQDKNIDSKMFFENALKHLVDLLLGKHFTVKVYSMISFLRIYEIAAANRDWISVIQPFTIVYERLKNFSQTGNFAKIHQSIINDFYISIFNAETDYNYPVIFIHLPRMSGMASDEIIPEQILKGLCKEFKESFGPKLVGMPKLKCKPEAARKYLEYQKSIWLYRPVVDGRELMEIAPMDGTNLDVLGTNVVATVATLQKKLNPWKFLPVGDDIADLKEEMQLRKSNSAEDGLIVVASLIDRAPNLGGLCRTCEIFGVSKYVISSLKVQEETEFKNLSVSAHNWVDLLEVPVKDLEMFLATYASKGYTIIGVEQATESTKLQSYKFPKKSLLLLGNEKSGIPTKLLHLLNQCLEIPQVGVVRSLNVHVTGALCIYQYASQHVM